MMIEPETCPRCGVVLDYWQSPDSRLMAVKVNNKKLKVCDRCADELRKQNSMEFDRKETK